MTTMMTHISCWWVPLRTLIYSNHAGADGSSKSNGDNRNKNKNFNNNNNNNNNDNNNNNNNNNNSGNNGKHDTSSIPGSAIDVSCSSMVLYEVVLINIVFMYMMYSAFTTIYYTVLYAPLYADVDSSIIDVLVLVLTKPYIHPSSREAFTEILQFMRHFGLDR